MLENKEYTHIIKGSVIILFGLLLFCMGNLSGSQVYGLGSWHSALSMPSSVPSAKPTDELLPELYYYRHPYLLKADKLGDEKRYDSAVSYYEKAALKFKEEKNWEAYVWVNGYIGRMYLLSAGMDYTKALPYLQLAQQKAKETLSDKHPYLGIIHYYLGLYYYKHRQADASLKELQAALALIKTKYGEQNKYVADMYTALGDVYYYLLFTSTTSETYYQQAISIKEALPGEKDPNTIYGYFHLTSLNLATGDYEQAQSFCYKAMQHTRYVKNHKQYWVELLEGLMANILLEQEKYSLAISRLQEVIRPNLQTSSDKGYQAYYYNSLADIYSRMEKYDSASINYKKALNLLQSPSVYNDLQLEGSNTNFGLGQTFLKLNRYKEALVYLQKSLDIRLAVHGRKHAETAAVYQAIGSLYLKSGFADKALSYLQQGIRAYLNNESISSDYTLPVMGEVNNSFNFFQLIQDKAAVLKTMYREDTSRIELLETSLSHYMLADSLMKVYKANYDRESAKLWFARSNNSFYEEAIECCYLLYQKTGDRRLLWRIFTLIDKHKASMLLEALRKRDIFKEAGIPFGKQQKHQMLQQELTFLQSRLEEESSKEPADDKILQAIHQKIQATEKELSKLQEELHGKYPYYAATQQRSDTLLLEDIETFSAHTKSTIVEYFWGEKALYALSTYAGKSALIRIPSSDTVQQHINTFRQCLNNGYRVESADQDYRSFSESAYAIYQHLLKPVLTRLGVSVKDAAGKSSLIVIPDGPLMHIPFEALTSQPVQSELADYRKLDYLLKHFTLSYTYSAGLLLKSYPGNSHKQANVLAISFSKEDILASNSGDIQLLRTNLNHELPGSAKELRAISSYMNGKFYIGEQATEGVFKKEAPRYDILHLAIHGEGNKEQTYSSRLIFKRETDSVNDGFLYSYELYNIPMQAKLAVLSACETGLGKSTPGEGIFSMARGFLYAGCSAVVMSYWQVNDQTTAQLMEYLYKNLSLGINIDQALGKAKLEYLTKADRRNAHPSNWAAFVAMGDMKPVMKAPDQLPFLAIGSSILTIFIMLLLLYLYRKKTKQVGNQEAI